MKMDVGSGIEGGAGGFWTWQAVEDRLVEAVHQWRRMPGGGRWPFASDGPWHLIRKQWEDWDARDPKPLRPLPLRRAEMREMEEATEWLLVVPEVDRRLVVIVLTLRARGVNQGLWPQVRNLMGLKWGLEGLRKRYSRGLTAVARHLNSQFSAAQRVKP
jgi:hypothetical protein